MHRPSRTFLPVALLMLLAGSATAIAAGEAPAALAAPEKPVVEVIATGDIAMRADQDERFIQEVLGHARRQDPTAKFAPRLEALEEGVRRLDGRFKPEELRGLSALHLESLGRHWQFYNRQLESWRRDLQRATGLYSDDAAQLADRRATWEATRAAAEASGVAPALHDRINAVLAEIAQAEKAISGPLDAQVKLSRKANALESGIDAGTRNVDSAIAYHDLRLTMIDSPPLAEVWRQPRTSKESEVSAINGLAVENSFLAEYGQANRSRIVAHEIFAVLLLPLLLWISVRSRRLVAADPELKSSAKALLRPISSWCVLVLVGTVLIEPDAPLLLHQTALLFALIPVLRLLPQSVFDLLGRWPYVLTVLYLFQRLGFFLVANPLLYRMHLLLVTVLAMAALIWLLLRRRVRTVESGAPRWLPVLRGFGWMAVAGLLVSVIANFIGNVSLAEMLTAGILDSGYVGMALFAGATVLSAMIKLLLARESVSRFKVVTQHTGPLLQSTGKLIRLAALAAWVVIALNEFRIYRPISTWVNGVLTYEVRFGQLSITLGSVLLFGLSVWIAFVVARTVRVVLEDEILPRMELPRGVGNSVSTLTYYALIMAGLFIALAASGFQVSQLTIVFGALGIGIGLGLQNVVNNFVSGLILMFERPIQPGDVIEVSGISGKVRDIGMRATTMTTFEGADVVVPNGALLSEKLINWTLSDMNRRIDVNIGVAYGSDPRKVLELLLNVATTTPGITHDPEPTVLFVGFGASSLDFAIRAWTNNFGDWVKIRSDMSVRLYEALGAAGIEIPFPQHDLHVRSVAPEARAVLEAAMAKAKPTG
jgi:small-conductance mechanosensitive channel